MTSDAEDAKVLGAIRLAQEFYRAGNLPAADETLKDLDEHHPGRADVASAKGVLSSAKGEHVKAAEEFATSLQLAPGVPETLYWAAITNLNLRRFHEAEKLARQLAEAAPKNRRGYIYLREVCVLWGG